MIEKERLESKRKKGEDQDNRATSIEEQDRGLCCIEKGCYFFLSYFLFFFVVVVFFTLPADLAPNHARHAGQDELGATLTPPTWE